MAPRCLLAAVPLLLAYALSGVSAASPTSPTSVATLDQDAVRDDASLNRAEAIRRQALALGERLSRQAETLRNETRDAAELLNPERSQAQDDLVEAVRNAERFFGFENKRDDKSSLRQSFLERLQESLDSNPGLLDLIPDAYEKLESAMIRGKGAEELPDTLGEHSYIFVSYSLGDSVLKDILAFASGRPDVAVVMRGIPEGSGLAQGIRRMQELAGALSPVPSVIIDPRLFRAFGIGAVPSVVRVSGPDVFAGPGNARFGRLVAQVAGLQNDSWLLEQVQAGRRGNFGEQGSTKEIAEPDLVDVLKERVMAVDWAAQRKAALEHSYRSLRQTRLPAATENRIRRIDPTIEVTQDILDANGAPIRRAGERVNPLDVREFTEALVIFNGTRPEEVDEVNRELGKLRSQGLHVLAIASEIDVSDGWKGYERLSDALDTHIFVLTPEVQSTWQIEATPCVVTADMVAKAFSVREIAVPPRLPVAHSLNPDIQTR